MTGPRCLGGEMEKRRDPLGIFVVWVIHASPVLRAEVFRFRKTRNRNSWSATLWIGDAIVWSAAKCLTVRSAAALIDDRWRQMRRELALSGVV